MFSLGDFHNLVGQSSEQPSLTGASPASSERLDLPGIPVGIPSNFFFFFFFPLAAWLCLLPWHYSTFSKGCCFFGWLTPGTFGLLWVRLLL